MIKRIISTVLIVWLMTFPVLAQTFEWKGLLHGMHKLRFKLEKNGTWLTGQMFTSRDTFELEGSWNGDTIDLLEFHDGLWTAKLNLVKKGDEITGYWIPRLGSQNLFVEIGIERPSNLRYYYTYTKKGNEQFQDISVSPTSGLDYFGHAFNEHTDSLITFYLNDYGEKKVIGLPDKYTSTALQETIVSGGYMSAKFNLKSWAPNIFMNTSYHSLLEVITPMTSSSTLDEYFKNWGHDFMDRTCGQLADLKFNEESSEWDKSRWRWNAYGYVVLYSKDEKCWSFTLHTLDFKGNADVQTLHYFPEKDEIFLLKNELKNYDRLSKRIGKKGEDWDEIVFHPHGLITISSFQAQSGIQRTFYPDNKIRRYYRLFSPLKWIK